MHDDSQELKMKESDKQSEEPEIVQHSGSLSQAPLNQQPQSQHYQEYQQFFRNYQSNVDIQAKRQRLQKMKIYYNRHQFEGKVSIAKVEGFFNDNISKFVVNFSYFTFQITCIVINGSSLSCLGALKQIGKGAYGSVYLYESLNQRPAAIKNICLPRKQQNKAKTFQVEIRVQDSTLFKKVLFEYCLCKLFSCLQIGPLMECFLGFDLVIFQDSICFGLQLCEGSRSKKLGQLGNSLKTMHALNVVHGDIKPDNIMWSPAFNKNVLIDYGLSRVLEESPGSKTLTGYFGTYLYGSTQMKNLLKNQQLGYVDLYYNDIHSYRVTEFELRIPSDKQLIFTASQRNKPRSFWFVLNIRLCYLIYMRRTVQIKAFIGSWPDLQSENFLIEMIAHIQQSLFYKELVQFLLPTYGRLLKVQELPKKRLHNKANMQNQNTRRLSCQERLTANQIMHFICLFYHEDVSPKATYRVCSLRTKLLRAAPDSKEYFLDLFELITNPYCELADILAVYDRIRASLGIAPWPEFNLPSLKQFGMTRIIAQAVHSALKINLYSLYREYISSKYSEAVNIFEAPPANEQMQNSKVYSLNEEETCEMEKGELDLRAKYQRMLTGLEVSVQTKQLFACIGRFQLGFRRQYELIHQHFPEQLFDRALSIELRTYYEILQLREIVELLNVFRNFLPARRTYFYCSLRKNIIGNNEFYQNVQDYFELKKSFYNQSHFFYFDPEVNFQLAAYERVFHQLPAVPYRGPELLAQIRAIVEEWRQLVWDQNFSVVQNVLSEIMRVGNLCFDVPDKKLISGFIFGLLDTNRENIRNHLLSTLYLLLKLKSDGTEDQQAMQVVRYVLKLDDYQFQAKWVLWLNVVNLKVTLATVYSIRDCAMKSEILGQVFSIIRKQSSRIVDSSQCIKLAIEYINSRFASNEQFEEELQFLINSTLLNSETQNFHDYFAITQIASNLLSLRPKQFILSYFNLQRTYISKISLFHECGHNFSIFLSLQVCLEKYTHSENPSYYIPKMQSLIISLFKAHPERFAKQYSHFVIVMEQLLNLVVKHGLVASNRIYLKTLLLICSLALPNCGHWLVRKFRATMKYHCAFSGLAPKMARMVKVRCLRESFYNYLDPKIVSELLSSQRCTRQSIGCHLAKLLKNKATDYESKQQINITKSFVEVFCLFINLRSPFYFLIKNREGTIFI